MILISRVKLQTEIITLISVINITTLDSIFIYFTHQTDDIKKVCGSGNLFKIHLKCTFQVLKEN